MRRDPGFLLGHLLGHYSLARSFWVHTVLIGWLFGLLTAYLTTGLLDSYPVRYSSIAVLFLVPAAFVLWVWSNIGTFASAVRRLTSGEGWFWSLVTMLLLSMGTRQSLPEFRALLPFLSEHFMVAMGNQPGEPFSVRIVDSGKTVEFVGGVNDGAAQALREIVEPAKKVTMVRLNSTGGWLHEGVRMAEVIRYFRLDTTVSEECASACTIAFLAGLDRTASKEAVLGFHSGRPVGGLLPSKGLDQRDERAIYVQAGVDKAFVERVLSTPPESLWTPTHYELLRSGVLTR